MSSAASDAQAVGGTPGGGTGTARLDAQVLQKIARGDRAAFAEIALSFQDRIYNAMRKMTGNEHDAADLTQETFAKAIDHAGSFRNEASAYTWMFRIAMNLATTRLRQMKRRRTVAAGQMEKPGEQSGQGVLDGRPGSGPGPDETAQRRERDEQVMAALARLPEDQRSLLVLRDVEGMDYQQIAQSLEVPLGTLKSRLFRARLALRDELKGYFPEGNHGSGREVAAT